MKRFAVVAIAGLSVACGSSGGDEGEVGAVARDGGALDGGGVAPDAGEDGGGVAPDAGGVAGACGLAQTERVDGVWLGRIQAPVVFEPGAAAPVSIPRRMETVESVAHLFARLTPDRGVAWSAQATLATRFDNLRDTQRAVVDPADGAVFVDLSVQSGGADWVRLYGADGMLARELTHGGPRGMDLIAATAELEHFLVKLDAAGALQFVKRFGLDDNGRTNTSGVTSMSVAGDRVRMSGYGRGALVFGAGERDELVQQAPEGALFWADFDKRDGSYVRGTARFAIAPAGNTASVYPAFTINADQAVSAAGGSLVIAGTTSLGGRTPRSVVIGAGGMGSITRTSTKTFVFIARTNADGSPAWVRTATALGDFQSPVEPRAAAIGADGTVVVGGAQARSAGEASVHVFSNTPGRASQRLALGLDEGFLAAYSPDGNLLWLERIAGRAVFPVHRLYVDTPAGAVYASGVAVMGQTLGPGEPTELRITVPSGVWVARFNLATGALEWARVIAGTDSSHELTASGDELLLTVRSVQAASITVLGGPSPATDTPMPNATTLLYRFTKSGALVRCRTLATGLPTGLWLR